MPHVRSGREREGHRRTLACRRFVHPLLLAATLAVTGAASAGCHQMLLLASPGYRSLHSVEYITTDPAWQQFAREHGQAAAAPYLEAYGLPPDTPVAVGSAVARYDKEARETVLDAGARVGVPGDLDPHAFTLTWKRRGRARGGRAANAGWAADHTSVAWLRARLATERARAAIAGRIEALARSGRYPHLAGFDPAGRGLHGSLLFTRNTEPSPQGWRRTGGGDACVISVDVRHPAGFSPGEAADPADADGDGTFEFPAADLRVYTDVTATRAHGGDELVREVRAIVAEEAGRLALVLADIRAASVKR